MLPGKIRQTVEKQRFQSDGTKVGFKFLILRIPTTEHHLQINEIKLRFCVIKFVFSNTFLSFSKDSQISTTLKSKNAQNRSRFFSFSRFLTVKIQIQSVVCEKSSRKQVSHKKIPTRTHTLPGFGCCVQQSKEIESKFLFLRKSAKNCPPS